MKTLLLSNAFFKSASTVDTGHKLNVHKTFNRTKEQIELKKLPGWKWYENDFYNGKV